MFVLETIQTDGIAQLSYLIGDTSHGQAIVIDPRTDVEIYVEIARRHGLSITHIFETHIHADFVSGSRSLAELCGTAEIFLSGENADYAFDGRPVKAGSTFDFGSFQLTARHTPGHTPEHLAFEISEHGQGDEPWGVFSGDSLFVDSAGRPDLLGDSHTEQLTDQLYDTLYKYFLKLPDHVMVFPGHGAGSACGASIGERLQSTIGYERRHNKFLRFPSIEEFREFVIDDAPPVPAHYPILKKVNAAGPDIVPRLPGIPALPPKQFRQASRAAGTTIIDTRHMLGFGGGHVPSAINIGDRPELSAWIGQMFDPDERFLLIVDEDDQAEEIQRLMVRTGYSRIAGYLAGGMKAWETAGLPIVKLPQVSVAELHDNQQNGNRLKILDVRSPEEWTSGHIPGAEHQFVADMKHRITGLDKDEPIATYCASGYRASLASSLMQARGFKHVHNVPGSWKAWTSAGFRVEKDG